MLIIATTRFNTKTWDENERWREKHKWKGCIYGTPTKTKDELMPMGLMVILEMYNDENKIMGLGLVRNAVIINKHYKIYSEGNYNRYTYMSKYRIDRKSMTEEEKKVINKIEILLFTGSHHLKRGQGITAVPDWVLYGFINFSKIFKTMFIKRFTIQS
tara:strand:+ start:6496 stop:6969 length:474 start_codon:yes stop_codon:yes gene_type:complete